MDKGNVYPHLVVVTTCDAANSGGRGFKIGALDKAHKKNVITMRMMLKSNSAIQFLSVLGPSLLVRAGKILFLAIPHFGLPQVDSLIIFFNNGTIYKHNKKLKRALERRRRERAIARRTLRKSIPQATLSKILYFSGWIRDLSLSRGGIQDYKYDPRQFFVINM